MSSENRGETRLSINPFDDGCRFSVVVNDEKLQEMGGRK
jgi:hypothetical protein